VGQDLLALAKPRHATSRHGEDRKIPQIHSLFAPATPEIDKIYVAFEVSHSAVNKL
jgi:hypothetical protein